MTRSPLLCYRGPTSEPGGGNGGSGEGAKRRATFRTVTQYSAATLELGVSVAAGAGIGYWLDSVFHTGPWLTLFWLLCGVFAGFRSLYRVAQRLEKAENNREDHGKAS